MEEAGGGKPVGQRAGPGPAWRAGPPGVDDEGSPASCVVATLGRTSFGERVRRGLSTRAGTGSLSVRPRSTPCRRQRCARRNVLISFIDNDAEIDLDILISESRSLFLSIDGSIHIFIDRKRKERLRACVWARLRENLEKERHSTPGHFEITTSSGFASKWCAGIVACDKQVVDFGRGPRRRP